MTRGTAGLVVLGLLLLGGCHSGAADAIRFGLANAPINLDPRFATDAASERINRLLYRALVDFDERQRPVPGLATWQAFSPRLYRFTLGAEGRRFHDGTRLTAADVAATYRSVLDPANASPHRAQLLPVERIRALDDDRIDFFLARPDSLFPAYLTIGIVPAARVAAGVPLATQPVGSGPFRFVRWPEAGHLELERVADRQLLVFEKVGDSTMRVLKLVRGEIDLLQNDLPPELVGWLDRRADVQVLRLRGDNFSYLGFNLDDPALRKPGVRRAIALALDRNGIIRYLLAGGARPASSLLPPEHWAGGRDLPAITTDRALARRLLADAGYSPDTPLQLTYKTSADPLRLRIATVIQQQLAEVGIRLDIRSYDWGTFYGDIKAGRFQLFSLAWVGVRTADVFRYVFHSTSDPPDGANRGHFRDARVDGLIEAAEAAATIEAKARLYRQLQAVLLAALPLVPLWYEDQFAAVRPTLRGYTLAADGNYDALARVRRVNRN